MTSAAATMGPKLAFSNSRASAPAPAPAKNAPLAPPAAPPANDDGMQTVTGVYRVDVHIQGVWAEVDRFAHEEKARNFAQRIVEVTRHEVSRIVLCGVKVGDVVIEDAILDMFEKPDPKIAAEKAALEAAEAEKAAKAGIVEIPQWRRSLPQVLMYGGGGLFAFLMLVAFGDKLHKIWFYLMSTWIWS